MGDYRIVYEMAGNTVTIWAVRHRKDRSGIGKEQNREPAIEHEQYLRCPRVTRSAWSRQDEKTACTRRTHAKAKSYL